MIRCDILQFDYVPPRCSRDCITNHTWWQFKISLQPPGQSAVSWVFQINDSDFIIVTSSAKLPEASCHASKGARRFGRLVSHQRWRGLPTESDRDTSPVATRCSNMFKYVQMCSNMFKPWRRFNMRELDDTCFLFPLLSRNNGQIEWWFESIIFRCKDVPSRNGTRLWILAQTPAPDHPHIPHPARRWRWHESHFHPGMPWGHLAFWRNTL